MAGERAGLPLASRCRRACEECGACEGCAGCARGGVACAVMTRLRLRPEPGSGPVAVGKDILLLKILKSVHLIIL